MTVLRDLLPPILLRWLTGIFYGWRGNYSTWEKAARKCTGYDSAHILTKVAESTMKVREGLASYERDSVIFDKIIYSFPVLSGLMWIAARNEGKINVLDFGGALGSSYYQNKIFLETLKEFNWCIVEQPHFVKAGKEIFTGPGLHFFNTIDECQESFQIDVILFSSVLEYLEDPYALLDRVFNKRIPFIIIDRTLFLEKGDDRITIQKVPKWIYKAKYPCWLFNERKFLNYFSLKYNLVFEFNLPERINVRSLYKGYLFQIKSE